MPSISIQGDSSPDPLGASQDYSSPVKAKCSRTPPRKALRGNAQAHNISNLTPTLSSSRINSPERGGDGTKENVPSPWQIRITVQAERSDQPEGLGVAQRSPSKRFAERTFTKTVPLKTGDESSPVRRNTKGSPRKPRNSSGKRRSTSKCPANGGPKAQGGSHADTLTGKLSPSPKRGRGRPRKSVDMSGVSSSIHQSQKDVSQRPPPSNVDGEHESPYKASRNRSNHLTHTQRSSWNTDDQHGEFDSIMESEGFSVVSVSSLPSAQGSSGMAAGSELSLERSLSSSNRKVTPSGSEELLLPPPPPKAGATQQSTRELEKPTSGTPKLVRVVRAGIALQGVLTPARQRHTSTSLAPWLNHSSPTSSTTSPMERLDNLFNGFGPGTRRELRAGLRLGEELAKRQNPEANRHHREANEDVFAPSSEVQYPELPATEKYSLKIPDAAMTKSPSFSNTQLPSPARSEAAADDDRMSWKFDTLQSNAVQGNLTDVSTAEVNYAGDELSPINQTMLEREAEYQREREAISRQIREANTSQVIVIDSDDEGEGSAEATSEDDGDIWQEEAQSSDPPRSTSDIPPIFLQSHSKKPRRSQIPSPWMRRTHDITSLIPGPNDPDLLWQPNHAAVSCENPEDFLSKPSKSRILALNADGANDDVEEDAVSKDSKVAPQASLPSTITEEDAYVKEQPPQQRKVTILNQSFNRSDSKDPSYEADDSDGSLTDDEDIESTLLSHHFMQDDITSPLDEGTQVDLFEVSTPTASTTGTSEETPEPRTPSCLIRTPKPSSSKKVRFTTETKASDSLTAVPIPLPPAPSSWFTRVTSLLPTWNASSAPTAAAIPLPTKPKKIIKLSEVDVGALPSYMPWQPSHWWALIHIFRQLSASANSYPYDPKSLAASWLDTVVSVNQWAKKITKNDCAVVERFMKTLHQRGTFKGMEAALLKGGKKQWGKFPGEWIDRRT
ncbi:MAG: hypothetical protein Q9172_006383, partial [Xanthocarpia lactea]